MATALNALASVCSILTVSKSAHTHTHNTARIHFRAELKTNCLSHTHTQEINTTDTDIELDKLEANAIYRILVVARGPYGTSLPSSMLLINTSNGGESAMLRVCVCVVERRRATN